jgi:hypothetical protein
VRRHHDGGEYTDILLPNGRRGTGQVIRDGADGRVRAEPGVFEEADEATFGVVMYLHQDAVGAVTPFAFWDPDVSAEPFPDTSTGFANGHISPDWVTDNVAVGYARGRGGHSVVPSSQPDNPPAEVAPAEYLGEGEGNADDGEGCICRGCDDSVPSGVTEQSTETGTITNNMGEDDDAHLMIMLRAPAPMPRPARRPQRDLKDILPLENNNNPSERNPPERPARITDPPGSTDPRGAGHTGPAASHIRSISEVPGVPRTERPQARTLRDIQRETADLQELHRQEGYDRHQDQLREQNPQEYDRAHGEGNPAAQRARARQEEQQRIQARQQRAQAAQDAAAASEREAREKAIREGRYCGPPASEGPQPEPKPSTEGSGGRAGKPPITWGHGSRHVSETARPDVEAAIVEDLDMKGHPPPNQTVRRLISVNGQIYTYSAHGRPDGSTSVGTYFPGTSNRDFPSATQG